MMTEKKKVGLFLVLPAPLNPIGAFDAEVFKSSFRSVVDSSPDIKFVAVDLSGLDFVYSDAYNAFIQCHQELSNRNGAFAVLADRDSLANSLRKVGLERFIRIFISEDSMASYESIDVPKVSSNPPKNMTDTGRIPVTSVKEQAKPAAGFRVEPAPMPMSEKTALPPVTMDKNPLVDEEPSSKGTVVAVVLLLLLAVAAVCYFLF